QEDELKLNIQPNPFNPDEEQVTISYEFPNRAVFTVKIYDVNGRRVRELVGDDDTPGQEVSWDGKDDGGNPLPVGIYVILVKAVTDDKTLKGKQSIVIARPID
ncbi:T9SS type A sorting domain-containing protein, partial [bacterium]|nr:T9SS type A sorting domain-containing protein [bacterium]